MKRQIELYIGAFVFVGLILLGTMIVSFRNQKYLGDQYNVYAVFNFISGVVEGAPVRYAGVDIGQVQKISLFEDSEERTKVRLSLGVKEGVNIKKDSQAVVNSLGIIGEKYIEIFPGGPDAGVLNPNDEIVGIDPIALENVMAKAQSVLKELESALASVNHVLTADTKQEIKELISNFKNAGGDIGRLSEKVEAAVDKINTGQGTIGQLIYAQTLHDELLALIEGLREHGLFYKAKKKDVPKEGADTKKGFTKRRKR